MKRLRQLTLVQSAELKLYRTVPSGQVVVVILVSPLEEAAIVPKKAEGILATGEIRDFPSIFENDRAKLVFILNGGAGIFSDTDPWFGGCGEAFNGSNPTAENPLGSGTSTWIEGYIESGLSGIFQLSDYPLYAFGAASYLMSGSAGHDICNSGSWSYGDFENLYAGLIWDLPGKNSSEDVSIGKQVYQLRDGFLLSKIPVSTSIGERAALYLGPLQTLQSKDIGQEVTLTTFYYIGKQHFVQGIAYVAFREKRLKRRWKEAQRTGIPYRPRGLCFLASTIDDRSFSVA